MIAAREMRMLLIVQYLTLFGACGLPQSIYSPAFMVDCYRMFDLKLSHKQDDLSNFRIKEKYGHDKTS